MAKERAVMEFAKATPDREKLFAAYKDYMNHYNAIENHRNVEYNKDFSLDEKNVKMNKMIREEVSRMSGLPEMTKDTIDRYITNPNLKWATFAVVGALIDYILPDTIVDSMGVYTDVVTGDFGSSFLFKVRPNDLFYVSKSTWGTKHADTQKQFDGNISLAPTPHDVSVYVSFRRVLTGEEDLATFVMKAARSIESQMTVEAYNAFASYAATLPSSGSAGAGALNVTGFDEVSAVKLAQAVTAQNQGMKAVFVGTQVALANLLPADANYRYTLDSDYVKIGYVPIFKGFDALVLPQVASVNTPYTTVLDDTKIYVVSPASPKIVKLGIEGSLLAITDGTFENANLDQLATLKKSWGTIIATNATMGVINLSA